ncbi:MULTISPECIES: LLM class flavin-dependent oxidoreductase [Pseudonocardia]|uniref:Methylenetetrahydromethanopterin reductase n=2 Tax=Pseudonocardia TaxID=1847 RepID=A0A1Y2MSN4_PSEAH|nr:MULTISPECIES: LLM class flavin-dependent oxidoreductase [Pseudonocardia]OSY38226.1 methylenetetrahydromethanopterin reductase [Pseudonocardia autotrophica]TDN71048.1 luciferase-like monooxygenase [Pseudonocardia autotrophica]BBG01717.1 5,10-methylenetetrahydromethanopterin reductase [Pseudonocardia autotrophica]GEC27408.1 5,10-methylenetetrahydromethanopterin reductase [Pseudonocardia saturnea]
MKLGCSFATSLETPEHIRIAEELGYERALCYDSPALYPDVWMILNRAAELTDRIVLGPGVLVPSLRHPMVTASAITTLVHTAGQDRVLVGVGSGFTGRLAMGRPPVPWVQVQHYTEVVRALLRGEQVEWEGALMQLIQPDERFGPALPITVGWGVAGEGPKGTRVARELGAELFRITAPEPGFAAQMMMVIGTVLDEGEDPGSERVIDAAGHGAGLFLHWAVEHGVIDELLGEQGHVWAAAYDHIPENVRHIALHDRHVVGVNDVDRPFVTGDVMTAAGLALTRDRWRDRFAELEKAGCDWVHFQPAGSDVPRELEAFAAAYHR